MNSDRHWLVLAATTVGLTLAFVLVAWLPQHRTITTRLEQIAAYQERLAAGLKSAPAPANTAQSVNIISDAHLDIAVPTRSDLGTLLSQLGEDLNAASVTDRKLQARAIANSGQFSRIPLTLHFQGSFDALFTFLKRIEARARVIRIDRLVAKRPGDNAPAATLNIDIELSTFFRETPEDAS